MATARAVPDLRIAAANRAATRADGDYVLYWMIANRRTTWNFALQRAAEWSRELKRPLLVLEALRCDYPWASDRMHAFVLRGMAENAARCTKAGIGYHAYVEPRKGAGGGLLEALAARACVVVTDDFPCLFLPRMVAAAAKHLDVRLEAVDSNGLLPLRAADRAFPTAYSFRRFLQRELPEHLACFPAADPLRGVRGAAVPPAVARRWSGAVPEDLARLPIDHAVVPVALPLPAEVMDRFVRTRLARYDEDRNEPDKEGTSGLSPYLHFGHVSAHEIVARIMKREEWKPERAGPRADGKRAGWWGMSATAEAFLDQLVTWRELGYNMCAHRPDYDRYESLPDWAQRTLARHERDEREHVYTGEEFAGGRTHDALWNAAQTQLVREGTIHNYLRMLWGKKILEWSRTPREALATMVELNNRYALDGRDPNSYSGILWTLGRYDRAWGPERPVFGTVRYMSSQNTARKHRVREYLDRYRPAGTV